MDRANRILLDLVKSSLWDTGVPAYSDPIDWQAVFDEAKSQSLVGIAYSKLPSSLPADIKNEWKNYTFRIYANYCRVMAIQDSVLSLTSNAGIPLVVLKGAASAVFYPTPSKRSMGDIDILVPQKWFEKANHLLLENGYQRFGSDKEARHKGYIKDGISIELHHHFSHDDLDIEHYLIEGFNNLQLCSIDNHEFPMFSPVENGIILIEHMRDHLKSGLGLRQVIDWMMYANKCLHDDFYNARFKQILSEIGLVKFAITITRMCQLFLGLTEAEINWCKDADSALCERLLESILSDGNMGQKTDYSDNRIKNISLEIKRDGLFHKLQKSGMRNWNAYHKHPWLKPFCWLYQGCRYFKQMLHSKKTPHQIKSHMISGNERLDLMKELDLFE